MNKPMQAKVTLAKARLYRLFALIFALTGVFIFVSLYLSNFEGSFFSTMTQPSVVLMLIIPFLPAIVLSWVAARMEKKVIASLSASESAPKK